MSHLRVPVNEYNVWLHLNRFFLFSITLMANLFRSGSSEMSQLSNKENVVSAGMPGKNTSCRRSELRELILLIITVHLCCLIFAFVLYPIGIDQLRDAIYDQCSPEEH